MTEIVDTATEEAQGTGSVSAATPAPELRPLSVDPVQAVKAPIELLPNELLTQIFGFLDSPKPSSSESVLHDEPNFELTKSDNAPLKAASSVSKRWRRGTIPLLFRHTQFIVEKVNQQQYNTLYQMVLPFLEFVLEHQLCRTIQSFTLIVRHKEAADILDRQEMTNGFSVFWKGVFKVIDPQELLIVAPAEALGILTNCRVYMVDAWNFHCPCHYLRLQVHPAKVPQVHNSFDRINKTAQIPDLQASSSTLLAEHRKELTLWDIRPWTTLFLNEGSFIRAYATYEFWLRKPPSVSSPSMIFTKD
jgi:F-box-like